MQWYPFFPGDYLRDTFHLSDDEDLMYRRMLDLCYRDGHLTTNRKKLYRQLRVNESDPAKCAAVESVISEFFFGRGKCLYNSRTTRELLKADLKHQDRVRGGKERAKRAARAQLSSSPAVVSTTTSTTTATEESPNSTFSQVQGLGIPLSLWAQYRKLRERLHRPIIAGAEDHIFAELTAFQAAGENPTEVLTRAVRTSSWKLSPNGDKGDKHETKAQARERRTEEAIQRAVQDTGRKVARETRRELPRRAH